MGTPRLDLPCHGFSRKEGPRVSLSLEKPGDTRGCCSLRYPITPSSPSIVAQAGKREEAIESSKRFLDPSLCEDSRKRLRTGSTTTASQLVSGIEDHFWLPANLPVTSSKSSYSSSQSSIHSLSNEEFSENDTWEACIGAVRGWDEDNQTDHQGLELVSLLTSCAESIAFSNHVATSHFLARIGEIASPLGSPMQRVMAYFSEALALRAAKLSPHVFTITHQRDLADQIYEDDSIAFRVLNHVTPIAKFLHCTLNERLLRVFRGKDHVHIIDFDIKQGLQWAGLLQSLALWPDPPTKVKITGIGESKQDLEDTGARLIGIAEGLNLHLEFHPVVDRLEDLRLWMLHVKERECVAVNCVLQLHKLLYDESGRVLADFLNLIRSTKAEIVLLAEEEGEHNGRGWELRLANALKYYAAIFDSLDASLPMDSVARVKVEEMFGREIRNIVACEGSERVERHESFEKWRKIMEESGFGCVGIGEREIIQSRLLIRMYQSGDYSVEKRGEEGHGLTLKWSDQSLFTVSAWALADIAGSSAASQPG